MNIYFKICTYAYSFSKKNAVVEESISVNHSARVFLFIRPESHF
jgi:hypothetical protein